MKRSEERAITWALWVTIIMLIAVNAVIFAAR